MHSFHLSKYTWAQSSPSQSFHLSARDRNATSNHSTAVVPSLGRPVASFYNRYSTAFFTVLQKNLCTVLHNAKMHTGEGVYRCGYLGEDGWAQAKRTALLRPWAGADWCQRGEGVGGRGQTVWGLWQGSLAVLNPGEVRILIFLKTNLRRGLGGRGEDKKEVR